MSWNEMVVMVAAVEAVPPAVVEVVEISLVGVGVAEVAGCELVDCPPSSSAPVPAGGLVVGGPVPVPTVDVVSIDASDSEVVAADWEIVGPAIELSSAPQAPTVNTKAKTTKTVRQQRMFKLLPRIMRLWPVR